MSGILNRTRLERKCWRNSCESCDWDCRSIQTF